MSALTTDSNHVLPVYPNLASDLVLTGIDPLCVADITYIRLEIEFVYLAVVLDEPETGGHPEGGCWGRMAITRQNLDRLSPEETREFIQESRTQRAAFNSSTSRDKAAVRGNFYAGGGSSLFRRALLERVIAPTGGARSRGGSASRRSSARRRGRATH